MNCLVTGTFVRNNENWLIDDERYALVKRTMFFETVYTDQWHM